MSDKILSALMQLFAIIARIDDVSWDENKVHSFKGRAILSLYLSQEVSPDLVGKYLDQFDNYLRTFRISEKNRDKFDKQTALHSVKLLRICNDINAELRAREKVLVLIRVIEFVLSYDHLTEQELAFVDAVGESFNLEHEEYTTIFDFVTADKNVILDKSNLIYLSPKQTNRWSKAKEIVVSGLDNFIGVLYVKSSNTLFFRYLGNQEITLNGQVVANDRLHILNQGSSFKSQKSRTIYHSDIISHFYSNEQQDHLTFEVNDLFYKFSNGNVGIQPLSFSLNSGQLVGIMGSSGCGKSTLLTLLSGIRTPTEGEVKINGINIHQSKDQIKGAIGYVSQDDLLIPELTVFENLYFNAQFCFRHLSKNKIKRKVYQLLISLGLEHISSQRVGSPTMQQISGGQRKRLNIALELIREPSILFVDEPTSGLSSRDSELVIDLLKQLTLKGKLVFTIIHQPSSDIFKMFDKLLILDQGGYPIFFGYPLDSIEHFKTLTNHVNSKEKECPTCGNVNPEQLFNLIEARVINESGNQTELRKRTAKDWYSFFRAYKSTDQVQQYNQKPKINFKPPNFLKQFKIFLDREISTKKSNVQYMLITALEAPFLSALLAFFIKFYGGNSKDSVTNYLLYYNDNLPQYIFMSVIIMLFLGLTVSAEEIIKDRMLLKREAFLNLSRGSYLGAKVVILFFISAFQSSLLILVGNSILDIQDLFFKYWSVLFSLTCFANMLGLLISSAFNSVKVIYIVVPLMIIPQLMFSGVIVKYEKLNPTFAREDSVPFIGNIMAARWAYESLTVNQFVYNNYEKERYRYHQEKSAAAWKRDLWIPSVRKLANIIYYHPEKVKDTEIILFINELKKEANLQSCNDSLRSKLLVHLVDFYHKEVDVNVYESIIESLSLLQQQYDFIVKKNLAALKDMHSLELNTKKEYANKQLTSILQNKDDFEKIIVQKNEYIQKSDPIYKIPSPDKPFYKAHFFSPFKYIFGVKTPTYILNNSIIWLMTIFLWILLYIDIGTRIGRYIKKIKKKHI